MIYILSTIMIPEKDEIMKEFIKIKRSSSLLGD